MVTGGVLAAVAFIICAFLQLSVEKGLPNEPKGNDVHIAFANGFPCDITLYHAGAFEHDVTVGPFGYKDLDKVSYDSLDETVKCNITIPVNTNPNCPNGSFVASFMRPKKKEMILIYVYGVNGSDALVGSYVTNLDDNAYLLSKPEEGGTNVKLLYNISGLDLEAYNASWLFKGNKDSDKDVEIHINATKDLLKSYEGFTVGSTEYEELDVFKNDHYELYLRIDGVINDTRVYLDYDIEGKHQGGSYVIVITGNLTAPPTDGSNQTIIGTVNEVVQPNTILMVMQIFQFFVITAGEILFSPVGLEFSYSQAPKSMKSVIQAAWLLTVAFGNVIVAIVASAKIFEKQSYEFFFFAALMLVDMGIFAIMAYFYQPYKGEYKDDSDSEEESNTGEDNPTFEPFSSEKSANGGTKL